MQLGWAKGPWAQRCPTPSGARAPAWVRGTCPEGLTAQPARGSDHSGSTKAAGQEWGENGSWGLTPGSTGQLGPRPSADSAGQTGLLSGAPGGWLPGAGESSLAWIFKSWGGLRASHCLPLRASASLLAERAGSQSARGHAAGVHGAGAELPQTGAPEGQLQCSGAIGAMWSPPSGEKAPKWVRAPVLGRRPQGGAAGVLAIHPGHVAMRALWGTTPVQEAWIVGGHWVPGLHVPGRGWVHGDGLPGRHWVLAGLACRGCAGLWEIGAT